MNKLDDIKHEHVLNAIKECVDTGEFEFLQKHGFHQAIRYVLLDDTFEKEGRYPSKAIVGVARKYARPKLVVRFQNNHCLGHTRTASSIP